MKHLSLFNESVNEEDFIQTLKDICLELSDIGCEVFVRKSQKERQLKMKKERPKIKLSVDKYDFCIMIRFPENHKSFTSEKTKELTYILIDVYERIQDYLKLEGYTENLLTKIPSTIYDQREGVTIEIFKERII